MIRAGSLNGECFWMDAHEASRADYHDFLKHAPAMAHAACQTWKTAYAPDCGGGDAGPLAGEDRPVTCVDWCDAMAFCTWAGKTLCRGDYAAPGDANRSDWYAVCSQGGHNAYVYGSQYDNKLCNGADNPNNGCPASCALLPVLGQTSCATEGGALNLTGNASEWVDECSDTTGAGDYCNVRGGSYTDNPNALRCSERIAPERSRRSPSIGFRCCAYVGG